MPRTPKTYDEIVRGTVPEPDTSWRPTTEQVRQAREGFRALDADETALRDRVRAAIGAAGIDTSRVDVEIERDRVTLRGHVDEPGDLARIEDVIARVEGVGTIHDQLVVMPASGR